MALRPDKKTNSRTVEQVRYQRPKVRSSYGWLGQDHSWSSRTENSVCKRVRFSGKVLPKERR